jgi:hypothetical protein
VQASLVRGRSGGNHGREVRAGKRAWSPAALLLALALAPSAAGPRAQGEAEDAFVELRCARTTRFAGEEVPVSLCFGFEAGLFAEGLVPLFRRPLDVPAQVAAPWLGGLAGAAVRLVPPPPGAGSTLAVNEDVASAVRLSDEERAGRTFAVFELAAAVLPPAPGELELGAPRLRFARATAFEDDLAQGRVATDRTEVEVAGLALLLTVLPLPEEGRPAGFTGAVGRFELAAEASPLTLPAGTSLKLVLSIGGSGDLYAFEAPLLDDLPGFHSRGHVEEPAALQRVITYDLAPRGPEVAAVPAIELPFFDPEPPGAYRLARSAPIALEVLPAAPPEGGAPVSARGGLRRSAVLAAVLALGGAAAALVLWVRRRASLRERAARG